MEKCGVTARKKATFFSLTEARSVTPKYVKYALRPPLGELATLA